VSCTSRKNRAKTIQIALEQAVPHRGDLLSFKVSLRRDKRKGASVGKKTLNRDGNLKRKIKSPIPLRGGKGKKSPLLKLARGGRTSQVRRIEEPSCLSP